MDERVECFISGCLKPAAALFGGKFYCRGHFVANCYERLDFCAEQIRDRCFSEQASEEIYKVIAECTLQAAKLSETGNNLNNIERARLLDILFYASDIGSHMRRSPRKTLAISVRLICESPDRQWQEDTVTRVVSRFGAMLECQHAIKTEDALVVERLDNGQRAKSRVAWVWRTRSRTFVVAVEFMNCSNFWELDWDEPPGTFLKSQLIDALQSVPKNSAR